MSVDVKAINNYLIKTNNYVDLEDPTSWKYYKNIAGEYHYTNTLMTIESLDTLETIEFTKENLVIHRATAKEYTYNSTYYRELLNRYPEQEQLILGILHPVDKQTAIDAEDGTILWYDNNYVDANEYDLIPRLETWIKRYMVRWNVVGYNVIQDLFPAFHLAELALNLPMQIELIRLSNVHTHKVNGFHVRMFLAGYLHLDDFYDYLSLESRLWLYRNIRYIIKNIGKKETFDLLVENILSTRGIPLTRYGLTHSTDGLVDNLLPTSIITSSPVNLLSIGGRDTPVDLRTFMERLNGVAKSNASVLEEEVVNITRDFARSGLNTVPTKTLESQIVDLSESGRFKRSDVLMQYWLFLSSNGRYNSTISFTNPSDGVVYRVPANDAWVMMTYFMLRSLGSTNDVIPDFYAYDILRTPRPTFTALRNISTPYYISDEWINLILSDIPAIGSYISTASFIEFAESIYTRMTNHYYQYIGNHDANARGEGERLVMGLYDVVRVYPTQYTLYSDWLAAKGFNFDGLDSFSYDAMVKEIIGNATGIGNDTTKSLKELQAALLSLMGRLSSYLVHYVPTINTEPLIDIGGPGIGVSYDTWIPNTLITHDNIRHGPISSAALPSPLVAIYEQFTTDTLHLHMQYHHSIEETQTINHNPILDLEVTGQFDNVIFVNNIGFNLFSIIEE